MALIGDINISQQARKSKTSASHRSEFGKAELDFVIAWREWSGPTLEEPADWLCVRFRLPTYDRQQRSTNRTFFFPLSCLPLMIYRSTAR